MATKLCPPGSYVLDAASFVSSQAVRNAVAHPNCDGLSLYNGGTYGVTIEQVKIVVDSGKCVGPNWERRANEAMFGTGGWAVDSARAGVEKWGIDPAHVPTILSGVDFSAVPSQYAQLDQWHETACDRADDTDTWIGYYGSTAYGNHLVQQDFWTRGVRERPTWTWGGAGMITNTNMKQHYGFPSGIDWSSVGVSLDESRVEAGLWMHAAEGDEPNATTRRDDMRWFVANAQPFPAFDDENGVHWAGPTSDGHWENGWLVFEIQAGGKRHVTGAEWGTLGSSSIGSNWITPGSPVQVALLTWEPTGWIQSMPNIPPTVIKATVDTQPLINAVKAATVAGCNAAIWDDTANTGGQQGIIKAVRRTLADTTIQPKQPWDGSFFFKGPA